MKDRIEKMREKKFPKLFSYNLDPNEKISKVQKKRTLYFKKLINYQKFRKYYSNVTSKQIKKNVSSILKKSGNILNNFSIYFEMRLDSILFRSHFAYSFANARQLIKHGFVTVNGIKVTNVSLILKPEDIIEIIKSKKKFVYDKLLSGKFLNKYVLSKTYKVNIKRRLKYSYKKIFFRSKRVKLIDNVVFNRNDMSTVDEDGIIKYLPPKKRITLKILHGIPEYLDVDYSLMSCFVVCNTTYKSLPYSKNFIKRVKVNNLLNKFLVH